MRQKLPPLTLMTTGALLLQSWLYSGSVQAVAQAPVKPAGTRPAATAIPVAPADRAKPAGTAAQPGGNQLSSPVQAAQPSQPSVSIVVPSANAVAPVQQLAPVNSRFAAFGPNTIADVAAAVAPAVVNINATAPTPANVRQPVGRSPQAQRLRRYYGLDDPSSSEYMKVTGSGCIVRPDGYILTSLHVVDAALNMQVTLQDGRSFPGTVIARDRFSDLAMIKIPAQNLQTVRFGNIDKLRAGDWVIAIGNQFGLGHTVTPGFISGLQREAKGFEYSFGAKTGAIRFIQTDAPINPGSSGGPLINLQGEVVGINTFIREDAQNIGFAVPSPIAKEVSDKLAAAGNIVHPYIGIVMRDPVQDPLGNEIPSTAGVEVIEVKPRSPAYRADLKPGDLILEVDAKPVRKSGDVSEVVAQTRIGESVRIKIKRMGNEETISVKVDPLPEADETPQ